MTSIFLSYARGDDEAFVRRLYAGLTAAGFSVWFDRVSMPARQLAFYQEIRDAIAACDRLVLVVGPGAIASDYVSQEWRFAYFEGLKCVNPIVRLDGKDASGQPFDGYKLLPRELAIIHAEDFRRDGEFDGHLSNLIRQLSEPLPPAGKLVAVPDLPPHFVAQPDRIDALRDMLLADLTKPVVVSGAAGRVGLQGMGGIGKSVLASALAHHPEVRRAFPDGVYWVTLGQQPRIEELQQSLLKAMGDDGIFAGVEAGKQKLREALTGRAALLVLDNAWQRPHAEAFNVVSGRCRLLLTTRDAGLVTALAVNENHYQVQLPTMAEAEALLARSADSKGPLPPDARAVIEQCGRLPLAVALCGGMARRGVPWADMLTMLQRHKLENIADRHPLEEQHANIWRAIDVSVGVLSEVERERFTELAVFALDTGAPEAAVLALWEHTAGMEDFEVRILLGEFAECSLIERDEKDGRIRLHDLVHNFATAMAEKLFGSNAALHQRLLDAYWKRCTDGWPTGPNDGYFFENLCDHLIAAEKVDECVALARDPHWLLNKCEHQLVLSLDQDYEVVLDAIHPTTDARARERKLIELLRGALKLSMHVLVADPRQLASQMVGRLLPFEDMPAIRSFIDEIANGAPRPWLRPLHPALQPPGGPLIRTLEGHWGGVMAVAITPDGRHAVSGSSDNTLRVWDLKGNEPPRVLEGHSYVVRAVAITPDGRHAVSGSNDSTLRVWDLKGNEPPRVLEGHSGWVRAVAITPDGRHALSGSDDNTLRVWDLEGHQPPRVLEGHSDWVVAVAITPDGRHAVSGSDDNTLRVWDLKGNEPPRVLEGQSGGVSAVAITPDGRHAVSGSDDNTLRVWDLKGNEPPRVLEGHSGGVSAVAITPDGRHAVSGSDDNTLRVWDLKGNEPPRVLEGHSGWVSAVAITPDGRHAVSGSSDNTLRVWDLKGNEPPRVLEGHWGGVSAVTITPDGRHAVSGSLDKTLLVWDLKGNEPPRVLEGHSNMVMAVAITPDGRHAVSGSVDKTLRVWDLRGNEPPRVLEGHSGWVSAVAITPDGRHAVSGSWDKTLRVWDLESHQPPRVLEGQSALVSAVAITPDGRHAVSGSGDRTLRVWDLKGNEPPRVLEGHSDTVRAVAITPDGRHAVSGSDDNTLRAWDLKGNEPPRVLEGHSDTVRAVAITPDGRHAVSGSDDNTLRAWDLSLSKCVVVFTCDAPICCCGWGRTRIVVGDLLGRLHLLELVE